jgi:hypothetical protein
MPLPDNIDAIPIFNEALSMAKLHPLHILCRYTSLSLLLPPPAHCHWPVPSLSSPTTSDHLVTRHLYKPRSFCRSAYSSLMMEAVRTSETSVDNQFTRQYNPEYSSEHDFYNLFWQYHCYIGKFHFEDIFKLLFNII